MKILLTATSLLPSYGGPAFSVTRLATALATEGAEVALWAADGSARDTALLASSSVERLNGQADDAFRRQTFDIVHDNGIWLPHNHRVAQLAKQTGLPRIVSTRGMLEPWAFAHKKWKKKLAWRLYQRSDLNSAKCCHVASTAEACNLKRLRLGVPIREIPNGMDVPEGPEFLHPRTDSSSAERIALFLGRIYPVKGLPLLVDAWSRIRPAGWRLRIAGPDEAGHRAEIERAIAVASLGKTIEFAGELHGAAKMQAYLDADLFVLPTLSESFGMAIAEALAHGVPVLTTRAAPWPHLLERQCGWWTDASAEGLAAALRQATSLDPARLREMGQRGRTLIREQFGWQHVARRMLETYAGVLAGATAPAC